MEKKGNSRRKYVRKIDERNPLFYRKGRPEGAKANKNAVTGDCPHPNLSRSTSDKLSSNEVAPEGASDQSRGAASILSPAWPGF
jgi:hypothetical protein